MRYGASARSTNTKPARVHPRGSLRVARTTDSKSVTPAARTSKRTTMSTGRRATASVLVVLVGGTEEDTDGTDESAKFGCTPSEPEVQPVPTATSERRTDAA